MANWHWLLLDANVELVFCARKQRQPERQQFVLAGLARSPVCLSVAATNWLVEGNTSVWTALVRVRLDVVDRAVAWTSVLHVEARLGLAAQPSELAFVSGR